VITGGKRSTWLHGGGLAPLEAGMPKWQQSSAEGWWSTCDRQQTTLALLEEGF